MSCCLHMHLIAIECHTLHISDTVSRVFLHCSTYSHVGCKVLSHMRPVATTKALKESCNLSWSWTQLTRRRDYLSVKPSQEIILAFIVLLSALSAKAKQLATC